MCLYSFYSTSSEGLLTAVVAATEDGQDSLVSSNSLLGVRHN